MQATSRTATRSMIKMNGTRSPASKPLPAARDGMEPRAAKTAPKVTITLVMILSTNRIANAASV